MLEAGKIVVNDSLRSALDHDSLADITTIGRESGIEDRAEVELLHLNGQIYLSNRPGDHGWVANLVTNPEFTYHLKQSVQMDLPALATDITNQTQKKELLTNILAKENRLDELDARLERSHLFRVGPRNPDWSA